MAVEDSLYSVWNPADSESKTPGLIRHLCKQGLLAGRPLRDDPEQITYDDLKPRNKDRVRVLKRFSAAPSGLAIKTIVSEVIKGQRVGQCQRIDGSDPDYQFVYEYLNHLTDHVPPDYDTPLLRKHNESSATLFVPRIALIDLISDGITQNAANSTNLYDRQFARDVLQHSQTLNDSQKTHLENSLESYLGRIDDYELLFDVTCYSGDGRPTTKRMSKPYATRFNNQGRIKKQFAQFNDALEYQREASKNAVLVTLTSDPGDASNPDRPDPRSIMQLTSTIHKNHNRLNQWLKTESDTIADTRRADTPQWRPELDSSNYCWFPDGEPTGGPPEGPVSGKPGKKLDFIKVLEFTESGLPHLHILFFDVPTREEDGMPWLIDKNELSHKWEQYGQGKIVDTYPLVYCDDLDDLDADFQDGTDSGFVDWYRFGNHDHSDEWIQQKMDSHDRIDFSDDPDKTESTAGAYLGKYLSVTFGSLMDKNESLADPDAGAVEEPDNNDTDEPFAEKCATWKLAMYWATQRRFWSMSQPTREAITPNEHMTESSNVAQTVRWASVETITDFAYTEVSDRLARKQWSDLSDLEAAIKQKVRNAIGPAVEATLPQPPQFGVQIDFLGAFAKWDLPSDSLSAPTLDDRGPTVLNDDDLPPEPQTDRPPPIKQAFHAG